MVRLGCDAFLTDLTKLLSRCNASGAGSVQLSFKRYAPNEAAAQRAARHSHSGDNSSRHEQHGKQPQHQRDSKPGKASQATQKAKGGQSANKPHPSTDTASSSGSPATSTGSSSSASADSSTAAPAAASSAASAASAASTAPTAAEEPSLLLHARLGSVKVSTVVSAQQAAKVHRQLASIMTAKASDGLVGGGRGGAAEAEAQRRGRERARQSAQRRKRQRDDREAKVAAGTASGGQLKRHKQEGKRREGNRKATLQASGDNGTADVEMKDAK